MLIYVQAITPRLQYTLDLIFTEMLGIQYTVIADPVIFNAESSAKLNYSTTDLQPAPQIIPEGLLLSDKLLRVQPKTTGIGKEILLFPNDSGPGFDIFSAVFYMVSRYEEYFDTTKDLHDRFPGKASFAYSNGFLNFPIVDIWVLKLKEWLSAFYPSLIFKSRKFNAICTYDIDTAYAFKGRSVLRSFLGSAKDLIFFRFKNIGYRWKVLSGSEPDPWDVYDELLTTLSRKNISSVFFFLLGEYSTHNKNIDPTSSILEDLIIQVNNMTEIGIHPSYNSYRDQKLIKTEKDRLEEITDEVIFKSRQHFLKFDITETFLHLIQAGITEDYSMGFADVPGFRAGTATPFNFFDLKNNRQTGLKIFPLTFMEGTFIDYLKLSPHDSLNGMMQLLDEVIAVNGTFISLWHNHTISGSKEFHGLNNIHDKMLTKIADVNSLT